MKINEWYERAVSIFEKDAMNGAVATNYSDGFLFANSDGVYALYIPGYRSCSAILERNARKSETLRSVYARATIGAELATKQRSGHFSDRKCKVREFSNENARAYVYEKHLRMFPKNALYYISGKTAPVVVGLWENDRFCEIGLVMPMWSASPFTEDA